MGHAGTLDPLATGLLVVAIGPATRFLQFLPLEPKEYVAEVEFGRATTTFDREGEVTDVGAVPQDLNAALMPLLPGFLGLVEQMPPMYSAVKVAGKPLYAYARKGESVERRPRTIHIGAIEPLGMDGNTITLRLECSGGTYVRTLAHDLGVAMGCGAHLAALRRTRVGEFRVDDASPSADAGPDRLIPLDRALKPMPMLQCDWNEVAAISEGRALPAPAGAGQRVALLDPNGAVVSVARLEGAKLQPECVIPAEIPVDA